MPALLGVLLLARPIGSQPPAQTRQQTAPPAKQSAPALRVTTRLVQVNVIAQDRDGQPITDLKSGDFALLDRGQRQKISVFSMVTNRVTAAATPPANVFSNRMDQKPGVPTAVTVILLDALNTQIQDLHSAQGQILKLLSQLQPQDRVAVYALTDHLEVLHEFTSDSAALVRALQRYKGHTSPQADQKAEMDFPDLSTSDTGAAAAFEAFWQASLQRMADFEVMDRVARTAVALEAIANHLAGVPGRKNLVWVSGAFPIDINLDAAYIPANASLERRSFAHNPAIERAIRALNNANLAVYPVDARGLYTPAFATSAPPSATIRRRGVTDQITVTPELRNFDTLIALADRTGGRAYFNTNDISNSVRQAIDDSQVTYTLGYYPAHGQWDGKFREIKVQVKRPGVQLRYRRGYFALADAAPSPEQEQQALRDATANPLDTAALGLTVRVTPVDLPGAREVRAELNVASQDISLEQQADRWTGSLDVVIVVLDEAGNELRRDKKTIGLRLDSLKYAEVMHAGAIFTLSVPIADAARHLRLVVRDATSGAIGSVNIPLTELFPAAPAAR